MPAESPYTIVELQSGAWTVRSLLEGETFHPVIGPAAEAEALYVRQLRLAERISASGDEFVIWDVGLGAGANALTAIKVIGHQLQEPKPLRLISFDKTTDALAFALKHATKLNFVTGFESPVAGLLENGLIDFKRGNLSVTWQVCLGDFPAFLKSGKSGKGVRSLDIPPPHSILFDPHSPQKNPAMWTLQLFKDLFGALDPQRPCSLANYTRATLARTAMLLGGFFVGVGHATGFKEETTMAANTLDLITEPLNQRWLERARRSHSAEPLGTSHYRCAPLSSETLQKLCAHPQFHQFVKADEKSG